MKKIRIVSLLLCFVLLFTAVVNTAAAEISGYAITENTDGDITFENLDDLKTLAEGSYSDLTRAAYVGEAPLYITDNITLPDNLCIDVLGNEIVISTGITLTSTSSEYSNFIFADRITVNGTLVCDFLVISEEVLVTGAVYNNNVIYLESAEGVSVKVIGAENIYPATEFADIYCYYYVETFEDIKNAVNDANKAPNEAWNYFIYSMADNILISEDITIPHNCLLTADYYDKALTFTIAEGCIFQLNCYMDVYVPLIVEGLFINNGYLDIFYDLGGSLEIKNKGDFVSTGYLTVNSDELTEPQGALIGIDTADFDTVKNEASPVYWEMKHSCGHTIDYYEANFVPATCVDEGYTEYSCINCEDSFKLEYIDATGIHEYRDKYDATCENCGFVREAEIRSVPMYRMYDPNGGEHFYTGSEEERDFLINAGWQYEGVGFNFPVVGLPVHRLYEPSTGEHLYTMDEEEMEKLLNEGWNYEGVAFNSANEDEIPQYRLHNPNASRGAYHFTGSEEERDILINAGWEYQGIGFYSCLR